MAEQQVNPWSSSLQIPLLQAAFLSGETSIQAWDQWKSHVNMDDHPDLGSFRLLPQVYRNLSGQGVTDSRLLKFKGVGRQGWVKNQQFFNSAVEPFQHLYEANIKAMLLYGPAIALEYSSDYRTEAAATLPIMTPVHQAGVAFECLRMHGWNSETGLQSRSIDPHINQAYLHNFDDSLGRRIQLHWHLLPECCSQNADDAFWSGAIETQIHGIPLYLLNPTDQIFHICVQDTVVATTPLFVRAIDTMFVLQAAKDDVNWSRLITQSEKQRLVLPVMKVLGFLHQHLGDVVPQEVLTQLQAMPVSHSERLEYESKNSSLLAWRRVSRLWFNYLRQTNGSHFPNQLTGFPKYLQHFWLLEHEWQVPLRTVSAAHRRLRRPFR